MALRITTTPNRFKQRLAAGEQLIGLWSVLGDGYAAELLAGCGYDWLLIDGEHGPNDLRTVLAQMQGIAAATLSIEPALRDEVSQPVVRISHGSPALIKQVLELGVRNLMVPMVESAAEARELVRAVRYPPEGIRGMGAGLARSANWGRATDYLTHANENICLIVQVESRAGIEEATAIAEVDGVDSVFFGLADLAGDMGLDGDMNHPEVVSVVKRTAAEVRALGKPTGMLTLDPSQAEMWMAEGMTFCGVGVDTSLLIQGADALLQRLRPDTLPGHVSY